MKRTIKRMLAMLLATLTLISALTLTASAETYSGRYNNLYYTTRLTIASDKYSANAKITYEGSAQIHAIGTAYYRPVGGTYTYTMPLITPKTTTLSEKTVYVSSSYNIYHVSEDYYIGTTNIETMNVNA